MTTTMTSTTVLNLDESGAMTALEVVDLLIKKRSDDIKNGHGQRTYIIREFSESASIDINGRTVESPMMRVSAREIDYAIDNLDIKNALATRIEEGFGVPNLPLINVNNIHGRTVRPINEIREKLDKYKRRARAEIKNLKAIGADIEEAQDPRTVGALEALTWLYNSGEGRAFADVANLLFKKLVAREKDMLFHRRRHPKQPSMHVCHDEQLLEEIQMLEWAIKGNPFDEIAKNGYGGYLGVSRF